MEFLVCFLMVCTGGFIRFALGWSKGGQKFSIRKFAITVTVTTITAIALATLFNYEDVLTTPAILACFLAGYSVDSLVSNLWDNLIKRVDK